MPDVFIKLTHRTLKTHNEIYVNFSKVSAMRTMSNHMYPDETYTELYQTFMFSEERPLCVSESVETILALLSK